MKRLQRLALAMLLVSALLVTGASAQVDGVRIEGVDDSGFPDVEVQVSVPLAFGDRDLPADAFRVFADGSRRQHRITQLPGEGAPLDVVVLVDTSVSMADGDAIGAAREAAKQFVGRLPASAHVAVIGFSSVVTVYQDLSDDRDAVVAAIDPLVADGATVLYESVLVSLETLAEGRPEADRVIVMLSDGDDNPPPRDDPITPEDTLAALRSNDAQLYIIELETEESNPEVLRELVAAGNGELAQTDDPAGLTQLYDAVAARVTNRYVLTYRAQEGGDTGIEVQLAFAGETTSDMTVVALPPLDVTDDDGMAVALPAPRADVRSISLPPWATTTALWGGIGALSLALLLIGAMLVIPTEPHLRLSRGHRLADRRNDLEELSNRATMLVTKTLQRRGLDRGIDAKLEQAAINLRAGEFFGGVFLLAVVTGLATLLVAGPLVAVVAVALVAVVPRLVVGVLADRRRRQFAEQIGDILQLLAGSLRAGYGLLQAIDTVAQEAPSPASDEFRRVVVESRLGRDLTEALEAAAIRVDNEDFEWVVQAISIHREVGGDLATVLDNVAHTIRQRLQVKGQVKALSAEGRLSAFVLVLLPIAMALYMIVVNPTYIGELTTSPLGWGMIVGASVLMVAGTLWLRRIVKLEY